MDADSMHRLTKLLADNGEAATLSEALEAFSNYGVTIRLSAKSMVRASDQIVALTAINAASRSFLGNVNVECEDFLLTAPGFEGQRFHDFLTWADVKGSLSREVEAWPRVSVGVTDPLKGDIQAWAAGWEFGIGDPACSEECFAPACVAAAGLAINEAFSILRKDNPYAGRRSVRLSLWGPTTSSGGPSVAEVPAQDSIWMVGLGHLGQAYAWTLGFMRPGEGEVFLQDVDVVSKSTISTSMLSVSSQLGTKKTRVVSRWLEERGFKTSIVERRFDEAQRVRPEEPSTALFGVDNAAARRVMEGAQFRLILDAGLGSGYSDFRSLRMRSFPGPSRAAELWASESEAVVRLSPAYRQLIEDGAEPCGVTILATRAVGAPFVGCVAAAHVIAERVRRQMGGPKLAFLDMNLREPERSTSG